MQQQCTFDFRPGDVVADVRSVGRARLVTKVAFFFLHEVSPSNSTATHVVALPIIIEIAKHWA